MRNRKDGDKGERTSMSRWLGPLMALALCPVLANACQAPDASVPVENGATAIGVAETEVEPSGGAAEKDANQSTPAMPKADSVAPLPIVATFSILGDIVHHVGGDHVAVTTLVGPGGDTHTFEPSPADGVALADAAIVFENGLGLEPWLNDLYNASGSKSRLVVVTDGLTLLPTPVEDAHAGAGHMASEDHSGSASGPDAASGAQADAEHAGAVHQHGNEFDPHVWHDVANVKAMAEGVRDALAESDPAHAAAYRDNAARYLRALDDLDAYVIKQVAAIPPERRKLVTAHDTFRYLAARYGFEIVGTALASASTEAGDPSAAHIAFLADQIRAAGVPVIFAENVQNPRLMEQIAREAGVTLGPPLYTDALGEPGTAGGSFIGMMRANADALAQALGTS